MNEDKKELILSFGENVDAYEKWLGKVPEYLRDRLDAQQTPAGEIHVYPKPIGLSPFEKNFITGLVDPGDLPNAGGIRELSAETAAKPNAVDRLRAGGIREPHLVMLGTAVPRYFYQALTERSLENGLLSRCLVMEAGERGEAGNPHHEPFAPAVLESARHLAATCGFEGVDLLNPEAEIKAPEPYVIPETEAASTAIRQVVKCAEARYRAANDTAGKALWTRAAEKTMKLALLHAISANVREPLITPEGVRWGWQLADHLTRRMLYQASMFVSDNIYDGYRQKALRFLKKHGSEESPVKRGDLLKHLRIDRDTFQAQVVDTLMETAQITMVTGYNGHEMYFANWR